MQLFKKQPTAAPAPAINDAPAAPHAAPSTAAKLAEAREAAAEAEAARAAAEDALQADILDLEPQSFAERRAEVVRLRQAAEDTAARVAILEKAKAEGDKQERVDRVRAYAAELEAMTAEGVAAEAAYLMAARDAWQAAQTLRRVQKRAWQIGSDLHDLWDNEMAATIGQYPRLGAELAEVTLLRLPAAGPQGVMLADADGAEDDAGFINRHVAATGRRALHDGINAGMDIARRVDRWRR
ncbi:hypothetical protein [Roseococcus suduntuyensis]|uniref:Uncharacterized protein n=1 Tax=Roseococcus suduntuyensis TaxID=455361 RepID=A0A840ADW2_9PROT|nr:hypothetical protein [Roseococcus suduntuyensis]MBB3900108.1 hypothetical protein [Roseococcus suduntuyensis]